MPNVTSTYNDDHTVILKVEIPSKEYMVKVDKKLKDYKKTGEFKGFRKGQVPMNFLRARFGNAVLFDEVSTLIDSEINNFIKENELYTVGRPIMGEMPPFSLQKPIDINLDVEIGFIPKFEVKGISEEVKLTYYEVDIPEAEIDAEIERIQKTQSRDFQEDVTDIQDGDMLVVALKEMENGALKEGGLVNESTYISLNRTSDDLKDQLLSLSVGNTVVTTLRDLDTSLSEEKMPKLYYQIEEQGVECSFDCELQILEVKRIQLKALNAEFFLEITGDSSIETLEQFREVVSKALKEDQEFPARRLFFQAIYDHLMDNNKDLPMPINFLKKWLDSENNSEMSWEEFNLHMDDFRWVLIKEQLARQHDLRVTKDDVERAIRSEIASYYNYQISPYHPFFDKQVNDMLSNQDTFERYARRILENKVLSTISEDFSRDLKKVTKDELKDLYDGVFNKEESSDEDSNEEEVVVNAESTENAE